MRYTIFCFLHWPVGAEPLWPLIPSALPLPRSLRILPTHRSCVVRAPGSFDHRLTERYCLYSGAQTRPHRIVHHPPCSLKPAEAEISKNTMTRQAAIDLASQKPTCHFGRYQEVVAWPIRKY